MEFRKNQSIYLQIADLICEHIITHKWPVGEKIESVREMAANIEVNPNTVMRAYSHLQDEKVILNKRGIGFFVSEGAPERIVEIQKNTFINEELPLVFKKMQLLGIKLETVEKLYKETASNFPG